MKKTRWTAAAVLTLALLAQGCASGEAPSSSTAPAGGGGGEPAPAQAEVVPMRYLAPGNELPLQQEVLKAVNERLAQDGVPIEVELLRVPWDAWDQKSNLMLSAGEPVELIHVMNDVKALGLLYGQKAIVPITDLLSQYPELKSRISDSDWREVTLDGQVLGVPARATWYSSSFSSGKVWYRQDLMDKLGLKAPTTVDEVYETGLALQKAIQEEQGKTAYVWDHMLNRSAEWLHRTYGNYPFYVDQNTNLFMVESDGTVKSWYETPEFENDCRVLKRFYDGGLYNPDYLTIDHNYMGDEARGGRFVFGFETLDYREEVNIRSQSPQVELGHFALNPEKGLNIASTVINLNAVPVTTKHPEAGIQFLDWLYQSQENYDLFLYGIQGKTYNPTTENMAEFLKGPDNSYLYKYDDWQIGHIDLRRFEEGILPNALSLETVPLEETGEKLNESPVAGFWFNEEPVSKEMANLKTEIIASIYPIKFGVVDFDANYPQAIERLKAAGLDKVVEEYRRQLEAFHQS